MKLTPYRLLAAFFIVIALAFYLNSRHNRTLPTGPLSQTDPINLDTSQIPDSVLSGRPQVEVTASKGKFIIELRPDLAQNSVINFLKKWAFGYCNSLTFHRVEDWVVQGCDPQGDGTGEKILFPPKPPVKIS